MKCEEKGTADQTWAICKKLSDTMADNDMYARTKGGTASWTMGCQSAANMQEELGDSIRGYIASMAGEKEMAAATIKQLTAVLAASHQQLATKEEKILTLTEDVRQATENIGNLTETVERLTKKVESNSNGRGRGGGGGGGGYRRSTKRDGYGNPKGTYYNAGNRDDGGRYLPPFVKHMVNWGGYCHTCGFNPIGKNHTSATCNNKKDGHKDDATAKKRMGGSVANKPENMQL
jgi:uncharacterized protein YdbL (DUF1318 family)